jgi:hypothetical protein
MLPGPNRRARSYENVDTPISTGKGGRGGTAITGPNPHDFEQPDVGREGCGDTDRRRLPAPGQDKPPAAAGGIR